MRNGKCEMRNGKKRNAKFEMRKGKSEMHNGQKSGRVKKKIKIFRAENGLIFNRVTRVSLSATVIFILVPPVFLELTS